MSDPTEAPPARLAYLAASSEGKPIYLDRALADADLVIPIGCLRLDGTLGYFGVGSTVFPTFSDAQNLQRFRAPHLIAWAPCAEPRLGRVKVERFCYRDADDRLHELRLADLGCHACALQGEYHVFDSVEPRLFFSPPGPVRRLEISGRQELRTLADVYAQLSAALTQKQATIEQLTDEIALLKKEIQRSADGSLWSSLRHRARRGVGRLRGLLSK